MIIIITLPSQGLQGYPGAKGEAGKQGERVSGKMIKTYFEYYIRFMIEYIIKALRYLYPYFQ